jgi:hypothetical protein
MQVQTDLKRSGLWFGFGGKAVAGELKPATTDWGVREHRGTYNQITTANIKLIGSVLSQVG